MKAESKIVKDNWKFYTLSAAAYSALEDIQEDDSQFNRFLHFAMEGYKDFHFDQSHQLEVAEITMKPWKQIDFPQNMVDWTKIGFKDGNLIKVLTQENMGNVPKTFDIDPSTNQPKENLPPPDIEVIPVTQDLIPFFGYGNFFGNPAADRIYGWGLTYNYLGYFDVDWKRRVFNFKNTVPIYTKIYLEYISDGVNYTGQTIIHPYAFKLIKLYIHWMRKENDDRYSVGEKMRAQNLYNSELDKVSMRMLNLSIDTIREILRSGYTLSIKN